MVIVLCPSIPPAAPSDGEEMAENSQPHVKEYTSVKAQEADVYANNAAGCH